MDSAVNVHRLQFAFTLVFHYLFPILTMGLAPLLVILKSLALWTGNEHYNRSTRFWGRIFGINFAIGVVTGIPMEFQFGTNWAEFSKAAGGVIGQPLAMEGIFSFFLESSFLGLFLYGEQRLGRIGHWISACLVFLGSWLSGYFIIATNAWMQHPAGYTIQPDGRIVLASFWQLLLNPWALGQYAHNMLGALQTGCFVIAAVGSFYLLSNRHDEYGETFVRIGVFVGVIAAALQITPTGDIQGRLVAKYQPATLAAMEGLFVSEEGAPIAILGQPDVERRRLDNPLIVPSMLSFLTYRSWSAKVRGLDAFPQDRWPDQIQLLYYSYHIMVGLGTIFLAVFACAALLLWRKRLFATRSVLWLLMLCAPLTYVANTAGWLTAELGRQPWLIHDVMRTAHGASPRVAAGNAWFTLLGFMGMYTVLAILWLFLVYRELDRGPEAEDLPAAAV